MKKYLAIFSLLVFMIACEDDGSNPDNYEYEETASEILSIDQQDVLDLTNTNGNIRIIGSDTAHNIYLEITRRVKSFRSPLNASDHINDITIDYTSEADYLEVIVSHPMNNELDYEVDFTIIGPIIFDYSTSLGNGNIEMDVISRNIGVTLGNGNAILDVILLNNCLVTLEAGNGNVDMIIPDITNAQVLATVGNGNITATGLEFENLISSNNSLQGKLGNGSGTISLFLGNGNLALKGY